jgi:hypothetical protein
MDNSEMLATGQRNRLIQTLSPRQRLAQLSRALHLLAFYIELLDVVCGASLSVYMHLSNHQQDERFGNKRRTCCPLNGFLNEGCSGGALRSLLRTVGP